MAISFTNPQYLILLSVIPLIILIHFFSLRHRGGHALRFANFEAISKIRGIDLYSKNISVMVLTIAVCTLLILSLSGLTVQRLMSSSGFSFVIAIDSSRSMEANDMPPSVSRIEAAKKTAVDFVESLPAGTKIGVISFSGNSFIEQDMTQEKFQVKSSINKIQASSVGGTDLYEAIITSTNLLKSEDTKAVILLSDGQINVGGLDDAVNYANENEVIIHSIAIGTIEGGETSFGLSKICQ